MREELLAIDGVRTVQCDPDKDARAVQAKCQVDSRDGIEASIARVAASRWQLLRLERQQPTLENVFLQYVKTNRAETGQ